MDKWIKNEDLKEVFSNLTKMFTELLVEVERICGKRKPKRVKEIMNEIIEKFKEIRNTVY